ncbi:MAG: hypothetical protein EXR72_03755 [Myxococcales bacterium]|nr:hypothetical protein [Myxococcales bacterium]
MNSLTDGRAGLERANHEGATAAGRLDALRAQLAAIDQVAVRGRHETLTAALAAAPVPERMISIEEIERASLEVARAGTNLRDLLSEIDRKQGALEHVRGAVARERLRDAEEALRIAEEEERSKEHEYEAWRLLREQMVAAEQAQASHLGQALAPDVGRRFSLLTGRRYQRVAMTAQLGTEGVLVAGEIRDVGRLSVGTREQLATLYRLSLAEHLQSALILDDQLVQSDLARIDWFRTLLREKARAFQIIVLTCRPLDYIGASALAPPGAPHGDSEDGLVRAINLEQALRPASAGWV